MMQHAAFTDIKVAGFLETTDGVAIAQIAERALPFPGGAEVAVMIDAIKIAANEQAAGQVGGALLVGVLAVIIVWVLFGNG